MLARYLSAAPCLQPPRSGPMVERMTQQVTQKPGISSDWEKNYLGFGPKPNLYRKRNVMGLSW